MVGFAFLPLAVALGMLALVWWQRAMAAERRASEWERVAREQGIALDKGADALKNQGAALDRLMRATDGLVHGR